VAAVGVPKVFPNASPRRVVRLGFLSLFAGILALAAALEVGVGPEVVTWPMLLAGFGIGALASQLGSVTVSAVPDDQSAEVGGLQNTVTFLGASIGTALAGGVLVSALSSSFLAGIQGNPQVPGNSSSQAQVQLAAGSPFIADDKLSDALSDAGVTALAIISLIALFFSRGIPRRQPRDDAAPDDDEAATSPGRERSVQRCAAR
jgi:hypothetical protein